VMVQTKNQVEWTAEVTRQLAEAGFKVEQHKGFPIVPETRDILENKRLVEFFPEVDPPVRKEIWAEGMLFLPHFG
jgi:hypothetical protein